MNEPREPGDWVETRTTEYRHKMREQARQTAFWWTLGILPFIAFMAFQSEETLHRELGVTLLLGAGVAVGRTWAWGLKSSEG